MHLNILSPLLSICKMKALHEVTSKIPFQLNILECKEAYLFPLLNVKKKSPQKVLNDEH